MLEHMDAGKKPKRPRDPAQLAKAIVDEATGQARPATYEEPVLTEHHSIAGRLGGKKGGPARAKKLTQKQRTKIAKKAAGARWGSKESE